MIRRVQRESKRTEVVLAEVTCDRCGRELTQVTGIGVRSDFPFRGVLVRGNLYAKSGNAAETRTLEAELCDLCAGELIEWIGSDDLIDREFTYERLGRPEEDPSELKLRY